MLYIFIDNIFSSLWICESVYNKYTVARQYIILQCITYQTIYDSLCQYSIGHTISNKIYNISHSIQYNMITFQYIVRYAYYILMKTVMLSNLWWITLSALYLNKAFLGDSHICLDSSPWIMAWLFLSGRNGPGDCRFAPTVGPVIFLKGRRLEVCVSLSLCHLEGVRLRDRVKAGNMDILP